MANSLAVKYFGSGTPAVYRNAGGLLYQIGNTFGTLRTNIATNNKSNLAVQFKDDLYCFFHQDIRKYNSGTGDWDIVHTPTGISANAAGTGGGIFNVTNDGTATLVAIWFTSGNLMAASVSTDGTSWTDVVSAIGIFTGGPRARMVFGTNIIMSMAYNSALTFFDVATNTFSVIPSSYNIGGTGTPGIACAVKDNRLFAHGGSGSASSWTTVSEFSGGTFVNVIGDISTTGLMRFGGGGSPNGNEYTAMFVDQNNDLIVLGWENRGTSLTGLRAWVIDTDLITATEITNTVVPSTIRYTNLDTAATDVRIVHLKDNVSVAGTASPAIDAIYLAYTLGAPFQRFIWNGQSALMAPTISAIPPGVALSRVTSGGGEYLYNEFTPELDVYENAQRQTVSGGIQLTVRVSGDAAGGATKTLKLFYSSDGTAPTNQATLTGVATGGSATRSGNQINSVTADNTTDYTFIWDVATDGFSTGDPYSIMVTAE